MAAPSSTPPPGHPIPDAVACARDAFEGVAEVAAWSLSGPETLAALTEIAQLECQVAELRSRLLTQAEEVHATSDTAVSTAVWLANTTQATKPEAHGHTRLARRLAAHPAVAAAMSHGEVLPSQASVICRAVESLPAEPDLRERATARLIELAAQHDARELKVLGRRILEVVDPEAADAHEAKLLEDEERQQAAKTRMRLGQDPETGVWRGSFVLPALEGDMLRRALQALAAPKHVRAEQGPGAYDHTRPTPHRLGEAFAEYVRGYLADRLPDAGGMTATVVVTMTLATLLGGLQAAQIDTGTRLSPGLARRLAAEAGVIPAVLGSKSRVLDLGRKVRFHTGAMRLALAIEQRHCQEPGCDVPAHLCHVHHPKPWSEGGETSTRNAELRCPRHHGLAHNNPPLRT